MTALFQLSLILLAKSVFGLDTATTLQTHKSFIYAAFKAIE